MSPQSVLLKKQTRNLYRLIQNSLSVLNNATNMSDIEDNYPFKKRIVSYLRQNLFDAAKLPSKSESGLRHRIFLPLLRGGGKNSAPSSVSSIQTECNCTEQLAAEYVGFDEYTDIWKYSFLSLASLVGLFSIVLIICLIWRIIRYVNFLLFLYSFIFLYKTGCLVL